MKEELRLELEKFERRLFLEAREIISQKIAVKDKQIEMLKSRQAHLIAEYEEKIRALEDKNRLLKEKLDDKEKMFFSQKKEFDFQIKELEKEWARIKSNLERKNLELVRKAGQLDRETEREELLEKELAQTRERLKDVEKKKESVESSYRKKIEDLNDEIRRMELVIRDQDVRIKTLTGKLDDIKKREPGEEILERDQRRISILEERVKDYEKENSELRQRIRHKDDVIESEKAEQETQIEALRDRMERDVQELRSFFLEEADEMFLEEPGPGEEDRKSRMDKARKLRGK